MKAFRKFFSILCIICLLFSFANVVAVGDTTTTPSIEIKYYNLQFGNQVYILYAVDMQNVDTTATPFMQYWTEEPTTDTALANPSYTSTNYEYRTLTDDTTETQKYYVFAYTNLTAKQMADVIYARACVTVGDKTYYSDVESFSICEYVAIQLGIADGYTATTNENLKNMLLSMLDYGTNAQKYFNYRTDCLANVFYLTFGPTATPEVEYEENSDGTCTAIGIKEDTDTSGMELVIASTYNGKPVTAIANSAFAKGNYTKVTIPSSVKTIGDLAFSNCKSLTTVVIKDGVTTIGEKAFEGCRTLKNITIPASLTELGPMAFPCNDGLVINYSGTSQQLTTLLNNSSGWNNGETFTFKCSDGTFASNEL